MNINIVPGVDFYVKTMSMLDNAFGAHLSFQPTE